jgi:molybdate transport system substrate-binding protein
MKTRFKPIDLLLLVTLPFAAAHSVAAELTILVSPPLESAMAPVVAAFRSDTHTDVKLVVAKLTRVRPGSVKADGADVVVASTAQLKLLARRGGNAADAPRELGRVRIGVFVRDGARMPNVQTADTLRQSLLAADSITYDNTATGRQFAKAVDKLGLAAELEIKTTRLADSDEVFDRIARGKGNDIGIAPVTEIVTHAANGLKLAGPLPADVHEGTVYAAAPGEHSKSPGAGRIFLQYLWSPAAQAKLAAGGLQ